MFYTGTASLAVCSSRRGGHHVPILSHRSCRSMWMQRCICGASLMELGLASHCPGGRGGHLNICPRTGGTAVSESDEHVGAENQQATWGRAPRLSSSHGEA